MEKYIVEGGSILNGEVKISGSKNASLPIIAACVLSDKKICLENCPNIHDVIIMLDILKKLGCEVNKEDGRVFVDPANINRYEIPELLMREMRSSVILVGALLR